MVLMAVYTFVFQLKKLLLSPSNKNYPREVDSHDSANSKITQLKKLDKVQRLFLLLMFFVGVFFLIL